MRLVFRNGQLQREGEDHDYILDEGKVVWRESIHKSLEADPNQWIEIIKVEGAAWS